MEKMTVNNREFNVIKLLGKGKGGYSYLVTDGENEYVLKQIHHEPCSYYNFGNKLESELNDYKKLTKIGVPMPKMLDVDVGKERILKEYICGDTVFDLVLKDGECLEKARKSKGLERSFKSAVPAEVYEKLKEELEQING